VLPKIAAGGAVSFGYIFGQKRLFSVDVGGVLTPNVKSVLGRGHIKSRLVAGQVHGCFEPVLGPVKVEGCAGLAAGRLAASATGLLNARSAASAWVAGLLRGGIRVPAQGRFGVHAAVDGTLNILRPGVAVAVEGGEPVEDNAPLFGYSGVLEAVWTFP
jgi:hypothetical protein